MIFDYSKEFDVGMRLSQREHRKSYRTRCMWAGGLDGKHGTEGRHPAGESVAPRAPSAGSIRGGHVAHER